MTTMASGVYADVILIYKFNIYGWKGFHFSYLGSPTILGVVRLLGKSGVIYYFGKELISF